MYTYSAGLSSQNQMILLRVKVELQGIKRKPLIFRYYFFDSSMTPEKNKLDPSVTTTRACCSHFKMCEGGCSSWNAIKWHMEYVCISSLLRSMKHDLAFSQTPQSVSSQRVYDFLGFISDFSWFSVLVTVYICLYVAWND